MDEFAKITPKERKILEILRALKPYERIEIHADNEGKVDRAWVKTESKFLIDGLVIQFTRQS